MIYETPYMTSAELEPIDVIHGSGVGVGSGDGEWGENP